MTQPEGFSKATVKAVISASITPKFRISSEATFFATELLNLFVCEALNRSALVAHRKLAISFFESENLSICPIYLSYLSVLSILVRFFISLILLIHSLTCNFLQPFDKPNPSRRDRRFRRRSRGRGRGERERWEQAAS